MTYQELEDNIMEWFDFHELFDAMKAIQFGWVKRDSRVSELRAIARRLLSDAWSESQKNDGKWYRVETGGLAATAQSSANWMKLEGILASWEAGDE